MTATLILGFSAPVHAQSPLTVQPSTGRVGVGNTNPGQSLDVTGNIKNSGSLSVGTTAQTGTANRFRYLNSMAVASRVTAQALANATETAISLTSSDFDTDGLHSNSVNNTRISVALAGKYIVTGLVGFAVNSTGFRTIFAKRNGGGSPLCAVQTDANSSGAETVISCVGVVALAAGDYVELLAFQNSGGSLNTSTAYPARLALAYIGE